MNGEKEKIIKKFKLISDKYYRLSLLFYELSRSIEIETKKLNNGKEIREYIKNLGLDYNKIKALSNTMADISIEDIKK